MEPIFIALVSHIDAYVIIMIVLFARIDPKRRSRYKCELIRAEFIRQRSFINDSFSSYTFVLIISLSYTLLIFLIAFNNERIGWQPFQVDSTNNNLTQISEIYYYKFFPKEMYTSLCRIVTYILSKYIYIGTTIYVLMFRTNLPVFIFLFFFLPTCHIPFHCCQ